MLKLEKVIGLTSLSNASIATASNGSDAYYAAGSCVIRYDIKESAQKSFYKASNAIACLSISIDEQYLAVGERGQAPNIIVWDIRSGDQHIINSGHKHGIGCIAFSPDSRYLISAGFKNDRQLIVWDWKSRQKISVQKVGRKVNSIAMSADGSFFITCGKQHFKWWHINCKKKLDSSLEVIGKPASILTKYSNAIFMDVKIASNNNVYSIASCGLLCSFDKERKMKNFADVDSLVTYSLVLLEYSQYSSHLEKKQNLILVGCSEGLIRIYSAATLEFMSNLPLPVTSLKSGINDSKFPACLALCTVPAESKQKVEGLFVATFPTLISIHADRSMIFWDISQINDISQYSYFVHHSACIWDLYFVPSSLVRPQGAFATCSADSTIRIWHEDSPMNDIHLKSAIAEDGSVQISKTVMTGIVHMEPKITTRDCDMIRVVTGIKSSESSASSESIEQNIDDITASTISYTFQRTIADVAIGLTRSLTDPYAGIFDLELPDRPQTRHAPRAFAVHPTGLELVCGDKSGLLRVYDLSTMILIRNIQAHSLEILTIHYSPVLYLVNDGSWTVDSTHNLIIKNNIPIVLLATAGRDRLVHVFNASDNYSLLTTLDRHSSPVTAIKFTQDGKRLLSCGSDHNIIFYEVNGTNITFLKNVITPYSTINGLAVEATNKFAISSGQVREYMKHQSTVRYDINA